MATTNKSISPGSDKKKSSRKARQVKPKFTVRVCVGSGGLAAGSQDVINAFNKELADRRLMAGVEKKCVDKTGCRGFCARDVIVDVIKGKDKITYQLVKPEYVPRIVEEHIVGGEPVKEWLVGPDYYQFHDGQTKIILSQCGKIDPEDINAYIKIGGYKGARKALRLEPFEIIEEVKAAGLRGRGGGGFPTGQKWKNAITYHKHRPEHYICVRT